MREDDDVRDYLSRYMDTVDKLHNMEIEINGDLLSIMLLHSLPSSFDNFCCAIKSRDNLPDIDALIIKIIEERKSKIYKSNETDIPMLCSRSNDRRHRKIPAPVVNKAEKILRTKQDTNSIIIARRMVTRPRIVSRRRRTPKTRMLQTMSFTQRRSPMFR